MHRFLNHFTVATIVCTFDFVFMIYIYHLIRQGEQERDDESTGLACLERHTGQPLKP